MKKVNGIEIRQRISDGYIDAVSICDACDKDFAEYLSIRFTKRFFVELSRDTGIDESDLVQQTEGNNDEIWVHPQVAINLSQWASTKLAVLIPKLVIEWFVKVSSKVPEVDKDKFVTPTGVKFEDIDPKFMGWIEQAIKYNPNEK
ncbi:MAG: KilA-N domain-containing protein [Odoribacter sp.]|nr:KilA-N domain-containing protein [Odoribacter sp.]